MAQVTREQLLDALHNRWGTYVQRFQTLPPTAQSAFLAQQGYARLADLLAHVIAWWEESLPAVERLLREPACRSPDYDVDAFNAQAVARFRDLDEPAVLQRFEKARLAQLRVVSSLPDAAFRNQPVVDRLHIEIIAHLGEHEVSEQRLH